MISVFIMGSNYTHKTMRDVYFTVVRSENFDDYVTVHILWKLRTTNQVLVPKSQKVCILKSSMNEYYSWPK